MGRLEREMPIMLDEEEIVKTDPKQSITRMTVFASFITKTKNFFFLFVAARSFSLPKKIKVLRKMEFGDFYSRINTKTIVENLKFLKRFVRI